MSNDPDSKNPGDKESHQGDGQHQQAQIPLLDDVVFNTALPFPKPKARQKVPPKIDQNAPRATDLFGGSPETAHLGPLSLHYKADDIDARTTAVRSRTDRVVDTLVAEYSTEIIERLRDELSAVLNDLKQDSPAPASTKLDTPDPDTPNQS